MVDFLIELVIAGLVMGVIDVLWLTVIANKFYKDNIGSLLLKKPNMQAAVVFYIIYVVGIVIFALQPALREGAWQTGAVLGALLGLVCYATYDLTNLATLKNWSNKVVLVDMAWGAFLTATVTVISYIIIAAWIN